MVWKTINEIFVRSKMTSLPNRIEVDDAKLTNTQDAAYAFNSHVSIVGKNLLAQNQPSETSSTTSFTNFNNPNTFFINPITNREIKHKICTNLNALPDAIAFLLNFCVSYLNRLWTFWPKFSTNFSTQENFYRHRLCTLICAMFFFCIFNYIVNLKHCRFSCFDQ